MDALGGLLYATAALLGAAGVPKLRSPLATVRALRAVGLPGSAAAVRVLGMAEIVVAILAIGFGTALWAAAVAAFYAGFAGFAAVALRRGGVVQSCGCFGARDTPVTAAHLGITVAAAAIGAAAIRWSPGGLPENLVEQPYAGVPYLAVTATCGWLAYLVLAVLPTVHAATRPAQRSS